MTKRALKHAGLTLGLLALASIGSTALAQELPKAARLPLGAMMRPPLRTSPAATDTSSLRYTVISFPGDLSTQGVGINPGASTASAEIVGGHVFNGGQNGTGFRGHLRGGKAMAQSYESVNDPAGPVQQQAYSVNDAGQVVGDYFDSAGNFHAYELDGTSYKPLEVPFTGATGTYSPGINNAGQIAGGWIDGNGLSHGFTLVGGTYSSFDYPGAAQTVARAINSQGDISGYWVDGSGNYHGFLKQGATYTSVDVPGAVFTIAVGLNDADELAGGFCPTADCVNTGIGEEGFVYRNGSFTTVAVPGEPATGLGGISNSGIVIGTYFDDAGAYYAFTATP